jgi:hypothetical protein
MALFGPDTLGVSLDSVARIIQMALTPVFLLTGLATLLNVFSTRLARVASRAEQAVTALEKAEPGTVARLRDQLVHLRRRSLALDVAVILAAGAGGATCTTVLLLFVGAFGDGSIGPLLFAVFGGAIILALAAIAAYAGEMLMAGTGIRAEVVHGWRSHLHRQQNEDET